MDRDHTVLFDDNDNERARRLSMEKQKGIAKTFPESIASLINDSTLDNPISISGESQLVFTEMGDFVWGHQFDKSYERKQKPSVDVSQNGSDKAEEPYVKEEKPVITVDKTIREVPIGKGLSEALNFLRERGTLNEDMELAGRNTDKKKSKLVGVSSDEKGDKEVRIDRTDEYGRKLTPKESFRLFSHQFHGKRPGKKKQEKRLRQHQEELKMKNPGQISDPRSGFTTTDKDMLGDKKVGHFLGIKRKCDSGKYSRCLKFRNV